MKNILLPWVVDDDTDSRDRMRLDLAKDPRGFVYVVRSVRSSLESWRYTAYNLRDLSDPTIPMVEYSTREEAIEACDKKLVEYGWILIDDKFSVML